MTLFQNGAFGADSSAITAPSSREPSVDQSANFESSAIVSQEQPDEKRRPRIVADATIDRGRFDQEIKPDGDQPNNTLQCADGAALQTPDDQHTHHLSSDLYPHVALSISSSVWLPKQQENPKGAVYRVAEKNLSKVRKPRRLAAQLDGIALNKTWAGTKSKGRKDRLRKDEKFVAAIWSAAAAGGMAVTLNLGIRRESMLINHENPRRRMMQHLSDHLAAAGIKALPYAFVFELTPGRDEGRLHLHGVIHTTGLSTDDLSRLSNALKQAASLASGALGGQRQLDMAPLHNAAGWSDYLLEDATRTAKHLGIDHPFLVSDSMTRLAKSYFEDLRNEARSRMEATTGSTRTAALNRKKKGREGFTVRSKSVTKALSGERDNKQVGDVGVRARRRPVSSQTRPTIRLSPASGSRQLNPRKACRSPSSVTAMRLSG